MLSTNVLAKLTLHILVSPSVISAELVLFWSENPDEHTDIVFRIREIWGFRGIHCDDYYLLGCDAVYLWFIHSLFNDADIKSDSNPTASNDLKIGSNDLKQAWKEAAIAWFKVLSRHSPREITKVLQTCSVPLPRFDISRANLFNDIMSSRNRCSPSFQRNLSPPSSG
jgi:hypothetical protein